MGNDVGFIMAMSCTMGSELMNSILYLYQYLIQCTISGSKNYNSSTFPCGKFLSKRPFMWINLLWIIMPSYAIFTYFTKIVLHVAI